MKNIYLKSLKLILLFFALSFSNISFATLQPGDIAIIGYKAEPSGDANYTSFEFTFILLATVPAGEGAITFTDHGWYDDATPAFTTNNTADGYLRWTPTTEYPIGTIIKVTINGAVNSASPQVPPNFTSTNANFTAQSTITSGWNLTNPNPGTAPVTTSAGDQVLVFQGAEALPTFIYGFTNSAPETINPTPGIWSTGLAAAQGNAASNSSLPPGLTNGTTAIAHTNDADTPTPNTRNSTNGWSLDNLVFTGPFVTNRSVMLTNIGTLSNWNGSETAPADIKITPGEMGGPIPTTMAIPNVEVTDANNVSILDGGAASSGNNTIFGASCVSTGSISKTYTIKNTGFSSLTLSGSPFAAVGANATSFSVTSQPTSPIPVGGSANFTVKFDPSATGALNSTITLTYNDPAQSPFVINIQGTGNADPSATITAANSVCQNSTLNLSVASAGVGATYVWSGHEVVPANAASTTAVPKISGALTYRVSVTDANGCFASSTKSVTANAQPAVTVNADQTICRGSSASLSATCLMNVSALLSGSSEVPANASTATGYATGTYNTVTKELKLSITFAGLTGGNPSAGHIHGPAAVGASAGVLYHFSGLPASASGTFNYTGTFDATNETRLFNGLTYINIHNSTFPGGEIRGQLSATACAADTYVWNPGVIAGQTVMVSPLDNQLYTLTASNSSTTCSNTATTTVNVTPVTVPSVYGPTVITQNVSTNLFATNCEYLATIVPGMGGVAGNVTVKEWLETTPPFKFVPRHYEIVPATQGTASVTLYFTQGDFDDYNSVPTNTIKLPTGPSDNAGIANIQLVKYDGVSSPNDGLPENYSGQPSPVIPTSIVFDTNIGLWKITFDVTSFSGFLVTTASNPLPVTLISFSGKKTGENENTLNWLTANEKNFSHFEIQRSENAKKFDSIGEVKGIKSETYQFVDNQANGVNYYRLKMIDLDGKYDYSKTISIENSIENSIVGNFYPNPTSGKVYIDVNATEKSNWNLTTYDVVGKIVNTETKILQKGMNKVALEKLALGVNFVRFESGKISEIRKIIKN